MYNLDVLIDVSNVNYMVTTCEYNVALFSVAAVCLCVCLSVCNALTNESFDLKSSFLMCRHIFRTPMSFSFIKVIRSRSRSQEEQKASVCLVRALNFECLDLKR